MKSSLKQTLYITFSSFICVLVNCYFRIVALLIITDDLMDVDPLLKSFSFDLDSLDKFVAGIFFATLVGVILGSFLLIFGLKRIPRVIYIVSAVLVILCYIGFRMNYSDAIAIIDNISTNFNPLVLMSDYRKHIDCMMGLNLFNISLIFLLSFYPKKESPKNIVASSN